MRLVIQRVSRAAVRVGEKTVAEIGPGLLVLVGVGDGDGRVEAEVLVVPQFTLYGDARKGRRPSWAAAAPPEEATRGVDHFAAALEALGASVKRGSFREHMEVEL